ncbi:hypothetical protein [Bizionia sp.]|uniref:hypothetical protein n=1 Tax=Bizionia sp. TaxID=1954480 RepID=UPI003A907947
MQDAINEILGIMSCFPAIYKIGIVDHNNIIVYYSDTTFKKKSFSNAIELLGWCEENLNKA